MQKRLIDRVFEGTDLTLPDDVQVFVLDDLIDYVKVNAFNFEKLKAFINLAPPFFRIFFEGFDSGDLRGFFMQSIDNEDTIPALLRNHEYPVWVEDTKWMLTFTAVRMWGKLVIHADVIFCICVDKNGGVLPDQNGSHVQLVWPKRYAGVKHQQTVDELLTSPTLIAGLMCLSLMNSQNIIAVENKAQIRDGEAKVRARSGKAPLRNYYTLKTVPGKRSKAIYNLNDRLPKNARQLSRKHWRRGYFAFYTEEKPLFGREGLHGLFWKSPAFVESETDESVEKSYRVDLDRLP